MYKAYEEAIPELMHRIETLPQYELRMEINKATDSGELELVRFFALSTTQDSRLNQPKIYDYGNVLFIHMTVDADRLKVMFNLIDRGADILLFEFPEIKQIGTQRIREQCNQIDCNHVNSNQMYSYRKLPFPYHLYQIPSKTEADSELHTPLGGAGLPFFRTKIQAQAYYLRSHIATDSTQRVDACIELLIEDKRGRFVNIVVNNRKIDFELTGNALDTCEIKLNGTNPALVESVSALEVQSVGIEFSVLPSDLSVILMQGAEIVDERFISKQPSPYNLTQGVFFVEDQSETNLTAKFDEPNEADHYEDSTENALDEFHPIVKNVASKLYDHGHYRQAVLDTYIALVQKVKEESRITDLDGTKLMQKVFSLNDPIIRLSTNSDEQLGFMWLFSGAVMAIRNPKAHNLDDALDRQQAKEWLGFASVLFRLLDGTI